MSWVRGSMLGFLELLFVFALVGCTPSALQSPDSGTNSPVAGSGGVGGGHADSGTTGQGAGGGGGSGGGSSGGSGVCQPGMPIGGAGGFQITNDGSTTWCGAEGGFPDDRPPPDDGLGTLSLIAGALGGYGRVDGIGLSARFLRPSRSAGDWAGKLYVADSGNRSIRQIDLATRAVTTLAGSYYPPDGSRGPCNIDGTGQAARFADPYDVAPGGDGSLYVSDPAAQVIRKIVIATGAVTTLAGSPNIRGSADGVGAAARFQAPASLASDGAGHLYVGDTFAIREVDLLTGAVTTLVGSPLVRGSCDGIGSEARFGALYGLTSDRAGHLYVADGSFIRKVDIATRAVTTEFGTDQLTPQGQSAFGDLYGVVFDGMSHLYLNGLRGLFRADIATGTVTLLSSQPASNLGYGDGNLYLIDETGSVDSPGGQILRFATESGALTPFVGSVSSAGFVDGSGVDARFAAPSSVTADGAGNIYVAEISNVAIRMVAASTNVVTTLAGGSSGGDDGVGAAAHFYYPLGLVADEDGSTLYISDFNDGSCAIRKLTVATQMVTTLAGVYGQKGNLDGIGTAARFGIVYGLALDRHGNLFVTDGSTVREIVVATGAVTTLAGSPFSGLKDGVGADAQFYDPQGIASDRESTLYVVDYNAVRKIDVPSATVSTVVGIGGDRIVLDATGNLYVGGGATIQKVELATKSVTTVVGDQRRFEVLLGPLPGALGGLPGGVPGVSGIALLPNQDLVMSVSENAILQAHFF